MPLHAAPYDLEVSAAEVIWAWAEDSNQNRWNKTDDTKKATWVWFHKEVHWSCTDFRENLVCSVLPGSVCPLAGTDPKLLYLFIYLTFLFQLPIFPMLLLRDGMMIPPLLAAQILSGPLPISASTWYTHSKKGLFQQLVTKGRKWEWSSPFALKQRDNVGMAALPHHTFLLVASSCMGHRPVDVACRDVHLPRKLGCQ